ncbi:MAG: hypothetical protein MUF15_16260, partial [Acidobacteria bacterium]|nr:hypothetical protein [Acidobacteriota bacterium]
MLKNYFAANFRTLVRQKGTAFINIVCLSTGISACLLFLLWTGDKIKSDRSLYITFALGFFILATACLNYIHLATARFLKRSKETALRKALGASNIKLTMQFLSESFLHILAALIFSM